MLFYRLILLSWVASSYILDGHLLQTQRYPLQGGGKREISYGKTMAPQRLVNHLQHHHYANTAPSNMVGQQKSLLTQVIASSMSHRGDHPRKFIDFLNNGAQWHRFMSKPRGHNSELRIHEGNYRVNLKYGNHDIQEQDDRRNRNPDMYAGEAITGENSLSKFMAPPVYDEEAAQYQRKTHLDVNYEADTPEAAATEKQNTEQFVSRLHSLMMPLGAPYDFPKGKGRKETYKMLQDNKQEEALMESDDEDYDTKGGGTSFRGHMPPVEPQVDRKRLSYEGRVQRFSKQSRVAGAKTMPLVRKYGLSNNFDKKNGRGVYLHHEEREGQANDREKADRKEQVDDYDTSNRYKTFKDTSYDRDDQEGYDGRQVSHWNRQGNAKHEEDTASEIEKIYEASRKDRLSTSDMQENDESDYSRKKSNLVHTEG